MQRLEVSGAVRPLQWPFGVKGLITGKNILVFRRVRKTWRSDHYLRHVRSHGTTQVPPGGFS